VAGPERTLSYGDESRGAEPTFVAPYLVLGLECERPLAPSLRLSIAEVDEVELARGAERSHRRTSEGGRARLRLEVPDGWMSGNHARLERREGGWILSDGGSKNGTFVGGARVTEHPLADGDWIEVGATFLLFRDRVERGAREPADVEARPQPDPDQLATLHPPLGRALAALERVAVSPVPVILGGETGTGKEVAARTLHRQSGRPGRFVAMNCGAVPEPLAESELFGHKKGAFSGATEDRAGLVRAADRGTLFLDEIGELPPALQVKLLRVLQEREVVPVGDSRPVPVDLRVVVATHRSLEELVEAGAFRRDLYARLAGFRLDLPPLRERREDLGFLIGSLLARACADPAAVPPLDRAAERALLAHDWPLNVRELGQALSTAVALAGGARVGLEHLPEALHHGPDPDRALRAELDRLLSAHAGNISQVARAMGKERIQIRRWCKRLSLDPTAYRGHSPTSNPPRPKGK
jgi:DNA-binding NtrC family response regulator